MRARVRPPHFCAPPSQTTVVASAAFPRDRLWLNGVEEDISRSPRVTAVLREMRARAGARKTTSGGEDVPASVLAGWRVHIVSRNTFPTAAGLASSAAGYACLVHALADALGVSASPAELSVVARQGSGSACRSLFGGFVRWDMGARPDGASGGGSAGLARSPSPSGGSRRTLAQTGPSFSFYGKAGLAGAAAVGGAAGR